MRVFAIWKIVFNNQSIYNNTNLNFKKIPIADYKLPEINRFIGWMQKYLMS